MILLASQEAEINKVIDGSSFERHEILIDQRDGLPILRWAAAPFRCWFAIYNEGQYTIKISPGGAVLEETHEARIWADVLALCASWLTYLRREIRAQERNGDPAIAPPDWALAELPEHHREVARQIEELQQTERRLRRMTGLLFETGDLLDRLVRDVFREMGYNAQNTTSGATYDVTVDVPGGRLLVEVTGIEGQVNKGSKKIAQVLSATQTEAIAGDRVCVAVNAYRMVRPADRQAQAVLTPEADDLLKRLGAVVFTTSDLFALWKGLPNNAEAARRAIDRVREAPDGLVRLDAL